jgi:hypothetical protein
MGNVYRIGILQNSKTDMICMYLCIMLTKYLLLLVWYLDIQVYGVFAYHNG